MSQTVNVYQGVLGIYRTGWMALRPKDILRRSENLAGVFCSEHDMIPDFFDSAPPQDGIRFRVSYVFFDIVPLWSLSGMKKSGA